MLLYVIREFDGFLPFIILKNLLFLRNLPKHIFKEKIATILFQNLQVQDSYGDVEQIISDMSKVKPS